MRSVVGNPGQQNFTQILLLQQQQQLCPLTWGHCVHVLASVHPVVVAHRLQQAWFDIC